MRVHVALVECPFPQAVSLSSPHLMPVSRSLFDDLRSIRREEKCTRKYVGMHTGLCTCRVHACLFFFFFFYFHHAFVKTINNTVCFWLYDISKILILTVPLNSLSAFYLCWSAPYTAVCRQQKMFSASNLTDIAKMQKSTPAHITRLNQATAGRWEKSPLKRPQRSSNSWYADIQMPPANSVFWESWKA